MDECKKCRHNFACNKEKKACHYFQLVDMRLDKEDFLFIGETLKQYEKDVKSGKRIND